MPDKATTSKLPYHQKIGEGNPSYMIRTHLTPYPWWKWRRLYLHILGRPDADRDPHDHPWGFTTIVLWGGYTEVSYVLDSRGRPTGETVEDKLRFLSVRRRKSTHTHLITKLHTKRVVTLVLRDNRKGRAWGFWVNVPDIRWTWVPWREYAGDFE